jgi:tRNA/tmRNA/rRNA uracil-C5-methylase (TrmA/RlmC/RlmD family)
MSEDFRIERLGAQGDGIAAGDGPVYVPGALPGETVRASRLGDRARLERVLVASAERVEPGCPHYGRCGGCALQHASDAFVARWKEGLVDSALAARGIVGVPVRAVATAATAAGPLMAAIFRKPLRFPVASSSRFMRALSPFPGGPAATASPAALRRPAS